MLFLFANSPYLLQSSLKVQAVFHSEWLKALGQFGHLYLRRNASGWNNIPHSKIELLSPPCPHLADSCCFWRAMLVNSNIKNFWNSYYKKKSEMSFHLCVYLCAWISFSSFNSRILQILASIRQISWKDKHIKIVWRSQKYKSSIEKRGSVNALIESQGVTEHFRRGQCTQQRALQPAVPELQLELSTALGRGSELWSLLLGFFTVCSVSAIQLTICQSQNVNKKMHKWLSFFRLESTCSFASLSLLRLTLSISYLLLQKTVWR